jgi:hypothetical protein
LPNGIKRETKNEEIPSGKEAQRINKIVMVEEKVLKESRYR